MPVITQQNDTIDKICQRVFSKTAGLTEQLLACNPQLKTQDPILPMGLEIQLPESPEIVQQPTINLWD